MSTAITITGALAVSKALAALTKCFNVVGAPNDDSPGIFVDYKLGEGAERLIAGSPVELNEDFVFLEHPDDIGLSVYFCVGDEPELTLDGTGFGLKGIDVDGAEEDSFVLMQQADKETLADCIFHNNIVSNAKASEPVKRQVAPAPRPAAVVPAAPQPRTIRPPRT